MVLEKRKSFSERNREKMWIIQLEDRTRIKVQRLQEIFTDEYQSADQFVEPPTMNETIIAIKILKKKKKEKKSKLKGEMA